MKHRLGQMLGQGTLEGMHGRLGTFHSIGTDASCAFTPRWRSSNPNFTVLDVCDDQVTAARQQLLQAEDIDDKRWPARMLAELADRLAGRIAGFGPSQVPSGEAAVFANGKGGKLYASYQERLKILNAADFGDLLLEDIRIFREHPDILRQYQQRFKFILVDEYQDTNVAQYLWLRLLSQAPSSSRAVTPLSPCAESRRAKLRLGWRRATRARQVRGLSARLNSGNTHPPRTASRPLAPSPVKDGRGVEELRRSPPSRTSAASAMTTSRSMAGAARRSITSCASTTIFPAQRSSGSSATIAPPATSLPPPPISSRIMRAGSARPCTPRTSKARRSP